MKIEMATDRRSFIISEKEACEITKNPTATFVITGKEYCLVKCVICYKSNIDNIAIYEATFISKELAELEIEVVGDDICQENVSL